MAIAKKLNDAAEEEWYVYIINKNDHPLEQVMVNSRGYGEINGEPRKTSVLRHVIERLEALSYAVIEPIQTELFQLSNEFFVSYYAQGKLYDKKFVFVHGSLDAQHIQPLADLGLEGVLHR